MKKKLILSAAVAVLLVVGGAYAYTQNSKMNIDGLRQQCKAKLNDWNPNEDIPESCSSHLKMLTEKHGIGEDEPNSDFRERIKSSDDFQLQMAIQDKLSDICQLQVGEPLEKLSTAQCLRAISHHKAIGLRTNVPVSIPIPIEPIVNLRNKCEEDFSDWESGLDIPQSCYNHLDKINSGFPKLENETHLEFTMRMRKNTDYNVHFKIMDTLMGDCTKQVGRSDQVLATPECIKADTYFKLLRLESDEPSQYSIPKTPPSGDR